MTKGLTTEEFIERAIVIHGTKYDYSKTVYKDRHSKVTIICKLHGEFSQDAKSHTNGYGCRECGLIKQGENRKLTTEDFINRMIKTYGENKFDFTLTEYINTAKCLKVKCIKHNYIITKNPTSFFDKYKYPCNICHRENVPLVEIKSTEEFIQEAIKVHGENKYNYDKAVYKNKTGKVNIICNECNNEFKQAVNCHLDKNGCPICARKSIIKKNTSNTESFIEKAIKIHNDLYDYSLVEYTTSEGIIKIICKKEGHGVFEQSAGHHLQGQGCKKCAYEKYSDMNRLSHNDFIKRSLEVHGNKYDYSITKYINSDTNVNIICKKENHGIFSVRPDGHLKGYDCWKCKVDKSKNSLEEFIERSNKIHNNKYDYSKVIYVNWETNVEIICKKHKSFFQTPSSHLDGKGCPLCFNKSEGKVYDELIKKYNIQKQFKPKWCKNEITNKYLPFDFVIEDYKIIIEVDGDQHFRQVRNWLPPEEIHKRDLYKMKCANDNNYSIIRIYQPDVYNDKYNWVNELENSIESIKQNKSIENHFIASNNIYDIFD